MNVKDLLHEKEMDFVIKITSEDMFNNFKENNKGYICITDIAGLNKIHQVSCRYVNLVNFKSKAITNAEKQGSYFWSETLEDLSEEQNGDKCRICFSYKMISSSEMIPNEFKGHIIYFLKDEYGCIHLLKKKSQAAAPLDKYLKYVQSLRDKWKSSFIRAYVVNLEESEPTYIWSSEDWRYDQTNTLSPRHQEYLDFIRNNRKDIIFLGPYKSGKTKGNHLCAKGHEWAIKPSNVMKGEICPMCKKTDKRKYKAEYITELLSSMGIEFIKETSLKRFGYERELRLDFLVCKNHHPLFAIEYNGVQHYKPIMNDHFGRYEGYKERRRNDQLKRDFCWHNGLPVIDFTYKETDEQIKETIYYFLKLFDIISDER